MILLRLFKGGGSTQTVDSIPEWAVPYIKNVMNTAESGYDSGQLAKVAGTNNKLNAVSGSGAQALADTTNRGIGALQGQQDRLNAMAQAPGADVSGLHAAARMGYDTSRQKAMGAGSMDYNTSGMNQMGRGSRDYDSRNIQDIASTGGYDTRALKDKAILEAGQRTADMTRGMGQAGTLGSSRQAVMQGAQNAATAAEFATIDQAAAQQLLQNRMNAEQLGISAHGMDNQTRLNAMQASAGANAQNASTRLNALGQEMQGHGQNFNQFLQGTQAALNQGNQDKTFRLQTEGALGQSVQGAQQLAGNAANSLGQIGTAQRGIEQEFADIPWTSLQRYASTIYGNPARQSGIAGGGGK